MGGNHELSLHESYFIACMLTILKLSLHKNLGTNVNESGNEEKVKIALRAKQSNESVYVLT